MDLRLYSVSDKYIGFLQKAMKRPPIFSVRAEILSNGRYPKHSIKQHFSQRVLVTDFTKRSGAMTKKAKYVNLCCLSLMPML